jgi:hypothetical protein
MHIYNWHHSNVTGIQYVHEHITVYLQSIPLAFYLPLLIPLCSPLLSPVLTWNPLWCDRICPPLSQVACKLTSPFSTLPHPSPSKLPEPRLLVLHYDDFKNPASSVRNRQAELETQNRTGRQDRQNWTSRTGQDLPTERRKTGRQMTERRMTERRKTGRRMTIHRLTEHRMTEHRKTLSQKILNTEWPNAELDPTLKRT